MSEERNLSWIYSTSGNEELQERYDDWAEDYDRNLEEWGWSGPRLTVELFARHVQKEARILDVGAGTGMVGECLRQFGYTDISALDLSLGMMEVARQKKVYRAFHQMTLGERLAFQTDVFDAVIGVGVFTLGHAPAGSFDELVRIIRPGGHLAFLSRLDVYEQHGFREKLAALEELGRVSRIELSEATVTLPNEPEAAEQCAYLYRVL